MYKVIIVEDDKGIAEGICDCLADWGMEARRIKDFRRVMEEIREYEPHLVIMDIIDIEMRSYASADAMDDRIKFFVLFYFRNRSSFRIQNLAS